MKSYGKTKPLITCGIYLYDVNNGKIPVCHSSHTSWKNWTIPKGLLLPGEEKFQCMVRELREETGIDLSQLNVIKIHELPPVKYLQQNKILNSYLVITASDLSKHKFTCTSLTEKKFPEMDAWKWISPHKIQKYLHPSQQENKNRVIELIHSGN